MTFYVWKLGSVLLTYKCLTAQMGVLYSSSIRVVVHVLVTELMLLIARSPQGYSGNVLADDMGAKRTLDRHDDGRG